MTTDELYVRRCIELAEHGAGYVAPNPMVGAVLVYNDTIIGEGYHQKYGEAHAEVNCIHQAASNGLRDMISQATLYVSLEPCAHYGKTPPCADLIIRHRIPKVIIGCRDPFNEVDGKGIEKLKAAGLNVITGALEKECKELNKRFFTFHEQHRPYIILKWAETSDGFIATSSPGIEALPNPSLLRSARNDGEALAPFHLQENNMSGTRLLISNEYTNRLVHKWRSEEAAMLVGTNTVINDDPELTTRLWSGNSPARLIVDMNLRLPSSLKVFNGSASTIIFNTKIHSEGQELPRYYQVTEDVSLVPQIVNALYQLKIQSVIVEGGAKLLQSFIDKGTWDEARIIRNEHLTIAEGLKAPQLTNAIKTRTQAIFSDKIEFFENAGEK